MGQSKLSGLMAITKTFSTGEEYDFLRDYLLTDPLKITHYINFWRQELPNATEERKTHIQATIDSLLQLAENQVKLTCNAYYFDLKGTEVNEAEVVETVTAEAAIVTSGDPSKDNLKVVAVNGEDVAGETATVKGLREKYAEHIKTMDVGALKLKVAELNAAGNNADAEELATFILGQGLYQGKKVKKWAPDKIANFLKEIKPKVVEAASTDAPEDNPAETDLHKRFAKYLGDNKMAIGGLRAECKYLMSNNEVDRALALCTFLLAEGEYLDAEKPAMKWSNVRIEEFVKSIRDDLEAHPMELKPEGFTDIAPEVKGDAGINPEPVKWDIKMAEMSSTIKDKIFAGESEDDVRAWVFETVKTKKVENLDMFYNKENTPEELNSMYATFWISYVSEMFKEKAVKELDVKAEIIKLIQKAIDDNEPALGKVVIEAHKLYEKRGEKVNLQEVKGLVYGAAEEAFPEYHKQLMEKLGEKAKAKTEKVEAPVIIQDTANFEKDHPEIWEEVKDAKTTKDVFDMARELEKKQDFTVVSEMITHLILSGKINDTDTGLPVKWDKSQIEIWINSLFKNAETVAEAQAKVVDVVESKETPAPLGEATAATDVENVAGQVDSSGTSAPVVDTVGETTPVVEGEAAAVATVPSPEDAVTPEITYPSGVVIPVEDENFKELYASSKQGLWQGAANLIKKWQDEGKAKKTIIHDLADKLKVLARNDDLTQCYTRNWRRTNLEELYNVVNKIATKMGVEGWAIA